MGLAAVAHVSTAARPPLPLRHSFYKWTRPKDTEDLALASISAPRIGQRRQMLCRGERSTFTRRVLLPAQRQHLYARFPVDATSSQTRVSQGHP